MRAALARIAEATEARAAERVEAAIAHAFPDLAVRREGGRIAIEGRGLSARLMHDARLRWIGGLFR